MQSYAPKSRYCTTLIDRVRDAYKAGFSKPLPYEPVPDDPLSMLEHLSFEDRLLIARSAKLRRGVMKMAQSGDVGEAMKRVKASRSFIDLNITRRESTCIALQLHEGVEGYVHYKSERYDAARLAMKNAIRLMNELQEKFGYQLDGRRVHLARNLLRLDARSGKPVEAARAAFELLCYAAGEDQAWPYPALRSNAAECLSMSETERHMVFNQVAREIALIFFHAESRLHGALLAMGETSVPNRTDNSSTTNDLRIIALRQWLCVKRASLEGRVEDFWSHAASFFRAGCVVPALWYGAALDAAIACDQEESASARSLHRQIVESAGSWENLCQVKYEVVFRSANNTVSK